MKVDLIRVFRRSSLRQRFLVAPLLGLVVSSLLAVTFIYESQRQNALLSRVAQRDLVAFNRYAELFVNLSEQHSALDDLLHNAAKFDEASLYDQAKRHLHAVLQAVEDLERALPPASEKLAPEFVALRNELSASAQAYRKGISAAVGLTTVNVALAPDQLALANERITAMNRAFVRLLNSERRGISAEIDARIHQSEIGSSTIAVVGVSVVALLLVLSQVLARALSRSIETQIDLLTELGTQAGASGTSEGSHEVERMTQAIAAFRQLLLDLRHSRDELELRVTERTQALQQANGELRVEVDLRKEAEGHLRVYAKVISSTDDLVVITDPDGKVVEINPAYQRATGRLREEVIGKNLHEPGRDSSERERYGTLWRDLKAAGSWSGEIMERRHDGESFPCWAMCNAVRDEHGEPGYYVCVIRDITVLKQNEQQLEQLAFHDALTGLPNRALFHDRLRLALADAERKKNILAVLYLDLDRFKYVNDMFGHAAGDSLLIGISQRFTRCLRAADTLARIGGDEFVVLLPDLVAETDAVRIAERMIDAAARVFRLGDQSVQVGASIGTSFFPKDGRDADSIRENADFAMYEAKQAGRGQCRLYSPEMRARGYLARQAVVTD